MECQSAHPIMRAESREQAPLLTFWPSAFPPACLGCGRTLLTAVLALASLVVLSGGNALAQGNVATTDREALVALYDATDGSNWTTSTNWKTTAPLKDWSGVTAPAGDSVIILSLVYNNLSGIDSRPTRGPDQPEDSAARRQPVDRLDSRHPQQPDQPE